MGLKELLQTDHIPIQDFQGNADENSSTTILDVLFLKCFITSH